MRSWFPRLSGKRSPRPVPSSRLAVECLEDRRLLAAGVAAANVLQTNLVSDLPGVAANTDPNLVNPWGISESPGSQGSPFWISDNGTSLSTLYNTAGATVPLVVSIPAPGGDPTMPGGTPTGTVFNIGLFSGGGFNVSGVKADGTTATSGPSIFLFVTEDGTIVGWNPTVNPSGLDPTKAGTYGIIAKDNSASGAVYKGLAIATDPSNGNRTLLYAADFHNAKIDVYDTSFTKVNLGKGAFKDNDLPAGYAPFNVQELNGKIYVSYAKQGPDKHDEVDGPHLGFVDVYNLDGSGRHRLASGGALNAPWGMAIAPASFGTLAGALLVGNFGNGHINAYNATTGASLGQLQDPDGEPIAIDGLWALQVGNGGSGGSANDVYFTAGLFGESHGLFGSLAPVAFGSDEGMAEEQMVQAFTDVYQMNLNTVQTDIANGVTGQQLHHDLEVLNKSAQALRDATAAFADDARTDSPPSGDTAKLAGPVHLHHDTLDDLFSTLAGNALNRH
jgi:uncharacterized protein (TIGR03118 family)